MQAKEMTISLWFKSSEFKIYPGEDEETNPFRFGKNVAEWVASSFRGEGYRTSITAEDWGWRVDCLDDPCPIWIGCGNVEEIDESGDYKIPEISNIVWQCFVEADLPFLNKIFRKIDPNKEINVVFRLLQMLIENTDHIKQVEAP